MKILIVVFLLSFELLHPAMAQQELQKCAEEKNKAIVEMVNAGKASDTSALKRLNELSREWKNCLLGKKIPELDVETLAGEKINTKKLEGKIVVMNFWFTTCLPCIAEMPALNDLVKEYKKRDIVFIGFAINNKKTLKKFLRKTRFDFKIIPDAGDVEELFGVLEHPVTFIIDESGKVRLVLVGGSTGDKAKTEVYLKIKSILDELAKAE